MDPGRLVVGAASSSGIVMIASNPLSWHCGTLIKQQRVLDEKSRVPSVVRRSTPMN